MSSYLLKKYNIEEWNLNQFMSFVLIYAAYSDGMVMDDELIVVEKTVGAIPSLEARRLLDDLDEMERLDIIVAFKSKFFATKDEQKKILSEIKRIYKSDGDYSNVEKQTYKALENIFQVPYKFKTLINFNC